MAYAAGVPRSRADRARRPRRSASRAHELPAADPRLGRRGGGAPHHGRAAARRGRLGRRRLPKPTLHRERLGGVDNVAWAPWRSLTARALDGLERRDEARALLEEELVKARRWGAPGSLARTLRLLGTIRQEDGLDLLHEAVETADGSPARLEHAKALTALGSALRLARKPSDARAPLRRRVRDRQPLRRAAAGRACPERALRRGWPPAAPGAHRPGVADAERAAGRGDWRPQARATATSPARST